MRRLLLVLSMVMAAAFGGPRDSQAGTIAVDTGWLEDTIITSQTILSFDFTLATAGIFSLTDGYATGDTWTISGAFAGVSTTALAALSVPLGLGATHFDAPWLSTAYSHFQIALAAGSYSIFVTGDGGGGVPAGVGARVDTAAVPLPAAGLMLLSALAGLGAASRRRKSNKAA